mgnify:CR=1 FL=1|tara:strand:+ start:15653 stop:15808 length:156 start_codon:yes stop_codon:yes gene_type:complete
MQWTVNVHRKVDKQYAKLPDSVKVVLKALGRELKQKGAGITSLVALWKIEG